MGDCTGGGNAAFVPQPMPPIYNNDNTSGYQPTFNNQATGGYQSTFGNGGGLGSSGYQSTFGSSKSINIQPYPSYSNTNNISGSNVGYQSSSSGISNNVLQPIDTGMGPKDLQPSDNTNAPCNDNNGQAKIGDFGGFAPVSLPALPAVSIGNGGQQGFNYSAAASITTIGGNGAAILGAPCTTDVGTAAQDNINTGNSYAENNNVGGAPKDLLPTTTQPCE